ncbi:MAG: acetyl-CoA carboxylase biotin carboxyl carrier protein subunit [Nitrosopumilaceae archaeon]|nr:acetyl-CoA carboxylase biotin carboxyl carrier protein subunit [Nitrosopumilaceae archaeon]
MDYKIEDLEDAFEGEIVERLGEREFTIKINDQEHNLKILSMNAKEIEFVLDQEFHRAKYLEASTNKMNIVIDNAPMTLKMHTNLDEIVYKNSGGPAAADSELALQSQIPGKVISLAVSDGDSIEQGETVCVLESMKMQVSVKAHKSGTVKSLKVKEGASVAKGDVIAEIE